MLNRLLSSKDQKEDNGNDDDISGYNNRNNIILSKNKGEVKPMVHAEEKNAVLLKPENHADRVFSKRIGYTVYHVGVHFSDTSTETAKDKILRLIVNEAAAEKGAISE